MLQQCAKEPEVRQPDDCRPEHTVAPEPNQAVTEFAKGIPVNLLLRRRRRHSRDAEARRSSDNGNGQRERADQPEAVTPDVEEKAASRGADDNRHESAHFEQAVGAREL